MASKNARTNRPAARSSRAPQSARAVRSAKAAQSGRIAPGPSSPHAQQPQGSSSFRSAYTPGSQGRDANTAFNRQTAASQYSRNNPSYSTASAKRMSRGKKIAMGIVAAVIVAVIGGGSAFALYINSINDQLQRGTKSDDELSAIQDVLTPSKSFSDPFYMLLIGSDKREAGSSVEGARSDTNIVVRVDPANNQVTLISIPRDTQIDIDGYGVNKFNAAYNFGGAPATIKEASQLCGIEISHYAEVNFNELVELVDAVGGVDVEVDERIDDPKAGKVVIEAGEQHLDGEAALVFARSRAYVDGDFTRTSNQRKLISAIVDKVLALPVTDLPGVIQSAAKCVTTDLSVNDIISLAQEFKDSDGKMKMYSDMVPSYTGYENDISYVYTDQAALEQMMKVVEEGGDPKTVTDNLTPGPSGTGVSTQSNGTLDGGGTSYDDGSGYYDDGSGYVDDGSSYDDGTVDEYGDESY